jgi:hypothetical protein
MGWGSFFKQALALVPGIIDTVRDARRAKRGQDSDALDALREPSKLDRAIAEAERKARGRG